MSQASHIIPFSLHNNPVRVGIYSVPVSPNPTPFIVISIPWEHFWLFHVLLDPQHLKQCLAHGRNLILTFVDDSVDCLFTDEILKTLPKSPQIVSGSDSFGFRSLILLGSLAPCRGRWDGFGKRECNRA